MAFLDNSGDIILDAVLTDTGRFRLAKGDGTFKIVKFAFADDEIDYGTYDPTNTNGSAYYDLKILQTPVLEAFTNNTSTMKSKLLTVANTNLEYLPVLKINTNFLDSKTDTNLGVYVVTTNNATQTAYGESVQGLINGNNPGATGNMVRVDQGLDTTEIAATDILDPSLREDLYIVQMDNRLGSLVSVNGESTNYSFLDDDNIAHYNFTKDNVYVSNIQQVNADNADAVGKDMIISGPRGTKIQFKIAATNDLKSSNNLFNKLGGTFSYNDGSTTTANVKFIDSTIRVMGATTGYAIDIPVRYIKNP